MTAAIPSSGQGTFGGPARRHAPSWERSVIGLGIAIWGGTLLLGIVTVDFTYLDAAIQVPVLVLLTIPIARWIARTENDPSAYTFTMAALSAKLIGGLLRNVVAYTVYGSSDSSDYDTYGKLLAPMYRHLDFSHDVGKLSGTGFLRSATGVVYAIFGTSDLGGYMVFSWLGFIGLLMCWRAFRLAVPEGDGRRYGLLVLFLPSLLYWPSAIGKEAWAIFGLGIASYGIARSITGRFITGIPLVAGGLFCVSYVRPHVTLAAFLGIVFAALVGKRRSTHPLSGIFRIIVLGLLFLGGLVVVSQLKSFLGVSAIDQQTINSQLDAAQGRSAEGGSVFTPVRIHSPIDVPLATATVLYRPFPFEAHNAQSIASSVEGMFLLWLTIRQWRRLRSLPRIVRRWPYLAYCFGFTLTFIFAFSAFSNFGILDRERTQMLPFFIALLCMPDPKADTAAPTIAPPGAEALAPEHDGPYAGLGSSDPYAQWAPVDPYADWKRATQDPYAP